MSNYLPQTAEILFMSYLSSLLASKGKNTKVFFFFQTLISINLGLQTGFTTMDINLYLQIDDGDIYFFLSENLKSEKGKNNELSD